jgi:hypothetical protein
MLLNKLEHPLLMKYGTMPSPITHPTLIQTGIYSKFRDYLPDSLNSN